MNVLVLGTICFVLASGGSICLTTNPHNVLDPSYTISCVDLPQRLVIGAEIPTCKDWLENQK